MSQCLNPDCLAINDKKLTLCQQCNSSLILKGRYRALKILGKGGFGRTFLAIDELDNSEKLCVIKQFLPQVKSKKGLDKALELFKREAVRLDELGKHNQIPALLAFFDQEERHYLIQEFIDGNDLGKELENQGIFTQQQIEELLEDMLSVLKFVHQNNVIHRDIKPENIIRRKQDNKLVLVDFGAAKENQGADSKQKTGTIIGSAAYISPEQAAGKPKFASDLYSLGATCLHLLTNIEPTDLFDLTEGEWIWREYLEDNEISYELSRVLDKLVEGATKRRFQVVDEVLEALGSKGIGVSHVKEVKRQNYFPQSSRASKTAIYGVKTRSRNRVSANPSPASQRKKPASIQNLKLEVVKYEFATITPNDSVVVGRHSALKTETCKSRAKYAVFNLNKDVTIDLIGVPGGQVNIGSPETELERSLNEYPQHSVKIKPFFLSRYPITQQQWIAVMKNNPSRFQGDPNLPVERVSWFDCLEFCDRVSALIGREVRLPSEAEWEYACRGKSVTPFHCGVTLNTSVANYNGEFAYGLGEEGENRNQTTVVGSFPPNIFGLYDLHGNVAEWCQDTWHDNYQGAPVDGSSWFEDNDSQPRILRGGSWLHFPGSCRSAHRLKAKPQDLSDAFGLRIASSL